MILICDIYLRFVQFPLVNLPPRISPQASPFAPAAVLFDMPLDETISLVDAKKFVGKQRSIRAAGIKAFCGVCGGENAPASIKVQVVGVSPFESPTALLRDDADVPFWRKGPIFSVQISGSFSAVAEGVDIMLGPLALLVQLVPSARIIALPRRPWCSSV